MRRGRGVVPPLLTPGVDVGWLTLTLADGPDTDDWGLADMLTG